MSCAWFQPMVQLLSFSAFLNSRLLAWVVIVGGSQEMWFDY